MIHNAHEHHPHSHSDHHWGIVLAGGQGTRLAHFIKARCGDFRPKQYCAIIGRRTMLRHTIDRIAPLFPDQHVMTTVNAAHLPWAFGDLHDRPPRTIIIQPYDRETGPAVLLPLLHVLHADPQAVIALFPADHFILGEERYRQFVQQAFDLVTADPERIVMLGVVPTSHQNGYGWIKTGAPLSADGLFSVIRFCEKPEQHQSHRLLDEGCLWNTMTLVCTAAHLLQLMEQHMNSIVAPLQRIIPSLGTRRESAAMEEAFASLPSLNFSSALLEQVPGRLSVLRMEGIYWSDWGEEQRVQADIEAMEHHTLPFCQDSDTLTAE